MSVQSIDRVFDILELLSLKPNGMSVTDISRALDLHKSTVSRLIQALRTRGYLERDPASGVYRIGVGFIELAASHLEHIDLRLEAKPVMYELSSRTGHTVFLAILKHDDVVYIDKTESYGGLRRHSIIGTRVPVHSSSLGKALLMYLSSQELNRILSAIRLEPRTPATITSYAELREELNRSRERGYAVDKEENEPGVRCVGAAVLDYRDEPIAAVSVSGPSEKLTDDRIPDLGRELKTAAEIISRKLGYRSRSRLEERRNEVTTKV